MTSAATGNLNPLVQVTGWRNAGQATLLSLSGVAPLYVLAELGRKVLRLAHGHLQHHHAFGCVIKAKTRGKLEVFNLALSYAPRYGAGVYLVTA
ncbi:MAG TPA: hypothetical protein VJ836_06310 [Candidatus Saccharimonadales bacterium]|nr:hypothetical protein [Candidatus Saccharimonadales bacterium]